MQSYGQTLLAKISSSLDMLQLDARILHCLSSAAPRGVSGKLVRQLYCCIARAVFELSWLWQLSI